MNQFDPNADDTEMRERRAARERFEMDALTPFEKFEQLTKKVVRVPKKEIIKSHKKLVAKKEQKRAASRKSKKKKPKK